MLAVGNLSRTACCAVTSPFLKTERSSQGMVNMSDAEVAVVAGVAMVAVTAAGDVGVAVGIAVGHAVLEPLLEVFDYGTEPFKRLLGEFRGRVIEEAAAA